MSAVFRGYRDGDVESSSDDGDNGVGAELRAALQGSGSLDLRLPPCSTFAPLEVERCGHVAIGAVSGGAFCGHQVFELPCDHGCPMMRGHGKAKSGRADIIHRFTMSSVRAEPLNESLRALCLHKEQVARALEASGRDACELEDDEMAGVLRTNSGGYQSHNTIFDGFEDMAEHRRHACCRELHLIASAAMDELSLHGREEVHYPDEGRRPMAGELHSAYAWINVNRATDANFTHVHDPSRWSAVYFVAGGAPVDRRNSHPPHQQAPSGSSSAAAADACPSSATPVGGARHETSGHLVFRGGPQADIDSTHSYLAVPPAPGTLWLFPGSVPHLVLGQAGSTHPPRDQQGRSDHTAAAALAEAEGRAPTLPRISVAINYTEALAPAATRNPLRSLPGRIPLCK